MGSPRPPFAPGLGSPIPHLHGGCEGSFGLSWLCCEQGAVVLEQTIRGENLVEEARAHEA